MTKDEYMWRIQEIMQGTKRDGDDDIWIDGLTRIKLKREAEEPEYII